MGSFSKKTENFLMSQYFISKDSQIYFILRMKYSIDDSFVSQLFEHPSFQQKLSNFSPKSKANPSKKILDGLAEQVCVMLLDEFKVRIDSECLTLNNSHLQLLKEVQQLKCAVFTLSPTKTDISIVNKDKRLNSSMLSELEIQENRKEELLRQNGSFMSSFLFDGGRETKQQLEERINATIINLSGDVAKFQSSVQQRLRNVEASLNRKMQCIYKTLTSVFETINDLQTKMNEKNINQQRLNPEQKESIKGKDTLAKAISHKLNTSQKEETKVENQVQGGGRRRSFLGFIKY